MKARARAEWEPLRKVAVHKPGLEVLFGLLDPENSLFRSRFNYLKARKEFENLLETLHSEGIRVYRVLNSIVRRAERDEKFYERLKEVTGLDGDPWFLTKMLVLRPKFGNEITVNPLPNLYFMRDQQITTSEGVIIGKMAKPQRRGETEVVKLFWDSISVKYDEVSEGYLEGGDFFPMGDFYLVGIGNRSDLKGVEKLISTGIEVGVVNEPPSTEFFHLDMYFNVISRELVIGVEKFMKNSQVDVYVQGRFIKRVDMITYLKEKEFNFHFVSEDEARKFATNFLTVKPNVIISPYNLKIRGVDTIFVDVSNLTEGFGGIRCMTAVIERG